MRRWILACVLFSGACDDGAEQSTGGLQDEADGAPAADGPLDAAGDAEPVDSAPDAPPEPDAVVDAAPEHPDDPCDPLVPEYCAYPFPSDFWTVADDTSRTGRRLALTAAAMPAPSVQPAAWNGADGFSPAAAPLAYLPGATTTGLASPVTIERSLAADSPTVLLHADTGERVPHWAELDVNAPPGEQTFMIRPAIGLQPGARYLVAIRGVVDAAGAALPPSPAFAALRDGAAPGPRRDHFEDLFARLTAAGVPRADLQLAWDFTVASDAWLIDDMVAVVDGALAAAGGGYTLTHVEADPPDFDGFALRVEGTVDVPLFLDRAGIGATLHRGPDGRPAQNGVAAYPFWLLIPAGAREAPAGLVQYGHGMLGSGREIHWDGGIQEFARRENVALLGMDWIGFSAEDQGTLVSVLSTGQMHRFATVPERLHQAMANFAVALRTVSNQVAADPQLQPDGRPLIDPAAGLYYYGASQGGIYGATYMALTPDIERGVLAVPGQTYSLMLDRSVNFDAFETVLRPRFPRGLDLPYVTALAQMLWDRAEPSGFSRHIRTPLPGRPAHEVLLVVAVGDHQVPTLAAHLLARTIGGVPQLGPVNRDLFGLDVADGPVEGSALIEFDFGETPEPLENLPATEGDDPHSRIGEVPAAFELVRGFLRDGVARNPCDGACDPD